MGASAPSGLTGLSACIFLPAAKRIPLQSLALLKNGIHAVFQL
jgi:hypothetical protein